MNAAHSAPPLESTQAQAAFAAAMQRPAAYAALHAVTQPITCIETHVSWVFLTGPFAYKVKKPLRLRFLDYSSAARRAAFCHEELRLNTRHAPGLYVDVVPIAGTPSAPRVGDRAAPAFEHALRMRQFDPQLELTHLLRRDTIERDEVAEFGARTARMHEASASVDDRTDFGTPATVERIAFENLAELAALLTDVADAAGQAALRTRLQRLFAACRPDIERRRRQGRVREVHGDLHCGNVVRWQGALTAFDGLEFDPALRFIDVASDVAFLSMDLAAHGRADLRREFLQAWLAAAGDFDAVALLPCFETCRALVRAKVAALRSRQDHVTEVELLTRARAYVAWAESRLARPPPTLTVMAGLAGSGKTWLAERAAAHLGAVIVRSDIERKRLAGLQPLQTSASAPDAGLYSREFNTRTYARLRDCVTSCLRGAESVIVDAANLRRGERAQFIALGREFDARTRIVHCVAPLDVLRHRVGERSAGGLDASEATVALLDRQPSYWEPFVADELSRVITVDTTSAAAIDQGLLELTVPDGRAVS